MEPRVTDTSTTERVTSASDSDRISVELSSRRTGMSFQRTRMSADRTLMSVIRTSLSLIGFGFTIFQVFQKLHDAEVLKSSAASRHFGDRPGVARHRYADRWHWLPRDLHARLAAHTRAQMAADGLVHAESGFPISLTLIVALLLLGIGILAIVSMVFNVGPF